MFIDLGSHHPQVETEKHFALIVNNTEQRVVITNSKVVSAEM